MTLQILYSPFPSHETAEAAARALLEQRLVACCNLIGGASSLYWWEGKVTRSTEVLLVAKTNAIHATLARDWLQTNHPYSVPAVLMAEASANAGFLEWLESQLQH
jgi:periplasmic divalent cation tolerance protein